VLFLLLMLQAFLFILLQEFGVPRFAKVAGGRSLFILLNFILYFDLLDQWVYLLSWTEKGNHLVLSLQMFRFFARRLRLLISILPKCLVVALVQLGLPL